MTKLLVTFRLLYNDALKKIDNEALKKIDNEALKKPVVTTRGDRVEALEGEHGIISL